MKLLSLNELKIAADAIKIGGLVAFPTETVYGLGADALNPVAVAGIFEAKKRPGFDPLIVHVADMDMLQQLYAKPINEAVFKLAEKFWPGPLTIVHKKSDIVPAIVTSDLDSVAVRMPSHPVALDLIRLSGKPIAAPSANKFGQLSPTSYKHVEKQQMEIDYIVMGDDVAEAVGIESTVVAIEENKCIVLRPGVITAEQLKDCLPEFEVLLPAKNIKLISPGLLQSHYSPLKPLYFYSNETELPSNSGLILHSQRDKLPLNTQCSIYTSANGNLLEVAANLFSSLHAMEENTEVTQIFIEKTIQEGIGRAIMDRLNKATFQYKS